MAERQAQPTGLGGYGGVRSPVPKLQGRPQLCPYLRSKGQRSQELGYGGLGVQPGVLGLRLKALRRGERGGRETALPEA